MREANPVFQVAIVVYPGMTALDAIGPYEVLWPVQNVELRFVWKEAGPILTDSRALVIGATHSFAETPRPDLVVVPGSSCATATMMADAALLAWLREVHAHTRFTTSVCSGSLILAAAGLLEGRPATSHFMAMPFLTQFGAEPRPNERVVRDGRIFTAAGVSAGIDLALRLVAEIYGEEQAHISQLTIEYDPQPPFDSGHMSKVSLEIAERTKSNMRRMAANPRELVSIPTVLLHRWGELLVRGVRRRRTLFGS
jgi:transcriptional regulator GlxA family with amidase domain